MSRVARKLASNFGPRALRVLGPRQYGRMTALAAARLPSLVASRDLRLLDQAMGRQPVAVRFLGRRFIVDCPATDAIVEDGTFTFGLVRELFIRNCYVRGGLRRRLDSAEYVLDLGANRGLFSVMAATTARRVIAVEVLPDLQKAIELNARANGMDNISVKCAFVGAGGDFEGVTAAPTTPLELLAEFDVPRFDVVKIDIEGSEFALFRDGQWLDRCGAIGMEVHPRHGAVVEVLQALRDRGFVVTFADHVFRPVTDTQRAEFIWACRDDG
jgi:hypothetical protein